MARTLTIALATVLAALCLPVEAQTKARSKKSTQKINWYAVQDPDDPDFLAAAQVAITEAVEANFRACTEENLKALMAAHTSNCPDREQFMKEAQKMFDETDVYVRLVKLEILDTWTTGPNGPRAIVNVWQWTVPKDEEIEYSEYRSRSAMLPKYELCEYQLRLHVENNQWKCHSINGQVFEAHWPEEKPAKD